MAKPIFFNPNRALTANITAAPGALAHPYIGGTTTPLTLYADEDETTPLPWPIVANAAGIFPQPFSSEPSIKVVVTTADGETLYTIDPTAAGADVIFDTVDDLKAATTLTEGAIVETRGYFAAGDGGGNTYEIVALGSGTNDGGSFMYLPGVNKQAKGLFPNHVIDVAKFGVPVSGDASAVFAAANAYALARRGTDMAVQLNYSGTCEIANPITLGGETAFFIDFHGSQINVIAGGTLASSPNQAAITIKTPQSIVQLGTLDCNLICGGYRISDSANTKFHFGRTLQFIWRGITTDVTDGTCAGAVFFAPTGTERAASDSYTTRTAVGFYNNCNDVRIISLHMGYCLYPIWNGPDGNGATFIECHPFNGSPNEVGGAQHSFTMVNECPVRAWCYNCYFDNGYIDDRTGTLSISDSWNVQLNSTLTDPIFRVKMPASPADLRGGADNIAFSMGFYTGAWNGPSPTLVSMNYDPAEMTDRGSRRAEYGIQQTRVVPDHGTTIADLHIVKQNATPIRHQYSATGMRTRVVYFQSQMRIGNATGTAGKFCLNTEGDGAWIAENDVNKGLIFGSANADRMFLSADGTLRPYTTDGTQNLGSSGNRWGTVFAATGTINTSDRRAKRDIAPISDAVLDAWSEVDFAQFRWADQEIDGDKIHVGVIAQDIEAAFARHGLNALDYGLLTFDEWVDDTGKPCSLYGVRMDQCLVLEMASLRRAAKQK